MGNKKAKKERLNYGAAIKKINSDLKKTKALSELAKKYPRIAELIEKRRKMENDQYTVHYTVEHTF